VFVSFTVGCDGALSKNRITFSLRQSHTPVNIFYQFQEKYTSRKGFTISTPNNREFFILNVLKTPGSLRLTNYIRFLKFTTHINTKHHSQSFL